MISIYVCFFKFIGLIHLIYRWLLRRGCTGSRNFLDAFRKAVENEEEKAKKTKVCRKKSRSTVRDVLDGESIHMTQVKEDTLDPVWNETFTM